jgi:hypothetical protein
LVLIDPAHALKNLTDKFSVASGRASTGFAPLADRGYNPANKIAGQAG